MGLGTHGTEPTRPRAGVVGEPTAPEASPSSREAARSAQAAEVDGGARPEGPVATWPPLAIDLATDRDRTAAIAFWLELRLRAKEARAYVINDVQLRRERSEHQTRTDRASGAEPGFSPIHRLDWRDRQAFRTWRLLVFPGVECPFDDLRRELRAGNLGRLREERRPRRRLTTPPAAGEPPERLREPQRDPGLTWYDLPSFRRSDPDASIRRLAAASTAMLEAVQGQATLLGTSLAVITYLSVEAPPEERHRPSAAAMIDAIGLESAAPASRGTAEMARSFLALVDGSGERP